MKEHIRTILDFPIKGIKYRDITTLLKDPDLFSELIDKMTEPWSDKNIDAVLIHKDALDGHTNLLIIDDLLATGGTALAAIDLVRKFESKNIVGAGFIVNLPELKGELKLKKAGIDIHSVVEF